MKSSMSSESRTEVGEERFLDSSLDSYPDTDAEALLVISSSAEFSFAQGVTKLVKASGPRSLMAALSYTMAASSAVSFSRGNCFLLMSRSSIILLQYPKMQHQKAPPLVNSYHKVHHKKLSDLPEIDCMLITQSLDDHCHLKTLNLLSAKYPNLRIRTLYVMLSIFEYIVISENKFLSPKSTKAQHEGMPLWPFT
ncbi:hypothetical protein F8388_011820 [Cannabis sativa]|uniref:Uncharacterized protein n=1 Tax=Cannabis sativa TaxID=3483 RepID=A0A7J6FJM8_CANSA|nr:hypothetical protein F8388_011820 [Cannabis sativa]